VQCEELAKKLIANESPYTADIERRQEQLRWGSDCIKSIKLYDLTQNSLLATDYRTQQNTLKLCHHCACKCACVVAVVCRIGN
jgi:hypothetical protein